MKFQRRRDAEDAMEDVKEVEGCMIISSWEDPGIGSNFDSSQGTLLVTDSEAKSLPMERVVEFASSGAFDSLSPLKRPLHMPSDAGGQLNNSILKRARYY